MQRAAEARHLHVVLPDRRGATSLVFDTPLATTTVGFSGVPPGRYFVRVRGINERGAGPATADVRIDVR